MYTICETPLFTKYCLVYWTQEEYEEFKTFLALNPEAGKTLQALVEKLNDSFND